MSTSVPPSYWQATARSSTPTDALPATADVAVVGGGLLGVCTLYWLARSGVRAVLLERDGLAAGATGRNGGFMTVGTAEGYGGASARLGREVTRAVWDLTLESRRLAAEAIAEAQIDCDFRTPGHLSLALNDEQLRAEQAEAAVRQADGYACEPLDRAQVQELIGTPLGEAVSGGVFTPGSALLHPPRFISGLAGVAARHGAQLCAAEVRGIARDGAGLRLETSAGLLLAGAVVVAANAWTSRLLPGLAGVVTPVRGQVLAYSPSAPVFQTGIGAALTVTGEYWQQTPDGTIVIGGCRAAASGRDVGVWEPVATPEVQQVIEGVLPQLFPALTGLEVAHRWAGLMAFTPDYLPVADAVPELPGAWVTGGFCGHGMPFGMRLGQLLAEAVVAGAAPKGLAPFRLSRPTLR
jgi:glycine/D-amino acid oxidase-like deaminating enzyme